MGNFFNIRARKFRSWKYNKIFGLENSVSVVFFKFFGVWDEKGRVPFLEI